MSDYLSVCEEAARVGGEQLTHWVGRFAAREKGPSDFVTEADLAAQEAIRKIIFHHFPQHGFIGEEDTDQERSTAEYRWIVDPLDGTTNYVHGIPHYATSVALERQGKILAATIFDPVLGECFTAAAGQGAYLNGNPIQVSRARQLSQALVASSFPARVDPQLHALKELIAIMPLCQGFRRGGSAALSLAYLAAGRFDLYWAADLFPWDAAAGALLVQEAGGVLTSLDNRSFNVWEPKLIAASTPELHSSLGEALANCRKGMP